MVFSKNKEHPKARGKALEKKAYGIDFWFLIISWFFQQNVRDFFSALPLLQRLPSLLMLFLKKKTCILFWNDKHEEIIYVITQNKHTISILFEAYLRDLAKHIEAH